MNSFGSGEIPKHVDQLAIVMRFHLLSELGVALHGVSFDLVRKGEQVGDAGDRVFGRRLAQSSNSFSKSARSTF
jgi:hypothetical protein